MNTNTIDIALELLNDADVIEEFEKVVWLKVNKNLWTDYCNGCEQLLSVQGEMNEFN